MEPRLSPTLAKALAAGRPVDAEAGGIAADSLAPRRVGELWENLRIVAEPGGASLKLTPSESITGVRRTCGRMRRSTSAMLCRLTCIRLV